MSRRATPTTPFIPPFGSPEGSPNGAPVIPGNSPSWGPPPMPPSGGYPTYNSPYSPYVPNFAPTPLVHPGVIPPPPLGQSHSRNNSRQGLSADWTGYPQGTPEYSPNVPLSGQHPPQGWGGYGASPGSQPTSPYYPASAPAGYPAFGGTPWGPPAAPLPPPQSTPWGQPPRGLPSHQVHPGHQAYTPAFTPGYGLPPPLHAPPPPAWGPPPPHQNQFYAPQGDPWGQAPGGYFPHQPPPRAPPEPPSQVLDRMDNFAEGDHYGPVLDPFIVRVVGAQVKINPLIQPLPEDGSEQLHLNWNMLFPTSTVQRSTDPTHVSWSKGRNAPATFPRITDLRLVSDTIPWIIHIRAKDKSRGVTCGEVIDGIGYDFGKFTNRSDFETLSPQAKNELRLAYKHNRSRSPGVPGGQLGEGMKRLDFLRKNTMFAGVDLGDRTVKRICGETLPCVFVLKCSATYPMTKQEVKAQETRMRGGGSERSGARSRANSTSTRITVQSPSEDSGSEGGDLDR